MNLSFSIKGWTGFSWDEYCDLAKDLDFKGIELHNIHGDSVAERMGPFDPQTAPATVRHLMEKDLCIPCIDTVQNIADVKNINRSCAEIIDCIKTAANLKTPYIRLYAFEEEGVETSIEAAVECLEKTIKTAEEKHVTLLVETVGYFADTAKLRDVLIYFASDNVAALWDMHYPYRFNNESAQQTIENLGAYVKHVHIKDSEKVGDDLEYCLIGDGSLPIEEMMYALRSINYKGFISLEWDPSWMKDLDDIEIIFAHYVNYMAQFDRPDRMAKVLYDNNAHTGKYIWKKDHIDLTFLENGMKKSGLFGCMKWDGDMYWIILEWTGRTNIFQLENN